MFHVKHLSAGIPFIHGQEIQYIVASLNTTHNLRAARIKSHEIHPKNTEETSNFLENRSKKKYNDRKY